MRLSHRSRVAFRSLMGIAIATGSVGCGGAPGESRRPPVQRFIAEAPQEILRFAALGHAVPVGELPLDPESWTAGPHGTELTAREASLVLTRQDRAARWIEHRSVLAAGDIDAIEVEVEGLRLESEVTVSWWSRETDGETIRSSLSRRSGKPPADGRQTLRFEVGHSRRWRGAVERLRVEIGRRPTAEVRMLAVRLFRTDQDSEAVAAAVGRGWAVELDGVVRSAMLGQPGAVTSRELWVGDDSRLSFFWGAPTFLRDPVELAVSAVSVDDAPPTGNAVLWRHRVDPTQPSELGRWHRVELDLGNLGSGRYRITLETVSQVEWEAHHGLPLWAEPVLRHGSRDDRPNIVLICLDTLRADHLSLYGYQRETSPVLDDWARRRAVTFETVVAPSPWTLPSHVSLFTGLAAHHHGINHPRPVPPSFTTLAERLREAGYATMAVTGGRYLDASYGLFQGFDAFASPGGDHREEIVHETRLALDWLPSAAASEPFFLFFHTYEVHDPYWPREPAYSEFGGDRAGAPGRSVIARTVASRADDGFRRRRRLLERGGPAGEVAVDWGETDDVVAMYDSGISRADTHVGHLLDALTELDLTDETVVILTSDHGEALGEHRLAGHTSLYDHDLLVPLVMALPGGAMAGERVKAQVRLLDLAPTVLGLAGIDRIGTMDGVDLLSMIGGGDSPGLEAVSLASLTNFGVSLRTPDGRKLIVQNTPWSAAEVSVELFGTAADPAEASPLATDNDEARRLLDRLVDRYRSEAAGLHLSLVNRGSWPMQVRIDPSPSVSISRTTVKTTDTTTRCSIKQRRVLHCELGPHQAASLVFEELVAVEGRFQMAAGVGDRRERLALEFDLAGGTGPWGASFGAAGEVLAVEAWWQGPVTVAAPQPEAVDDDLRDQLRALGYVE